MFSIAVENGWFDNNPCISKRVKPLREDSHRERFLEPHEEQRMLKECIGPFAYFKAILICALHTGMRKGEILNLEWSHVGLKAGYITATKTKTGKDRNIPLTPTLMAELSELQAAAKSAYVFTNPETGDRYGDVKRVFETITMNAKVTGLRFHDLRHTAATRMVAAGIDLIVVQEILGHESITTTMRYSHPVPERKLQAVLALENYVSENSNLLALNS
jgi:integrase